MEGLTIHCMVRNEPFVWYAVRSVYEIADEILLYDTGSYDAHTRDDIRSLMVWDNERDQKIVYEHVRIDVDETLWTNRTGMNNYRVMASANRGKRGKWFCRQKMIADTKTNYFMILDGDEVHYGAGAKAMRDCIDGWPVDKLCGFVPLVWHCDLHHTFGRSSSGRVFKTDAITMTKQSPGELHTVKSSGERIGPSSDISFVVPNAVAYAHFETMLKPWRRKVAKDRVVGLVGELPEIMIANPFYWERWERERRHSTLHSA